MQIPSYSNEKVLEGHSKTLGSHIWLANVAASSWGMALTPPSQNPLNFMLNTLRSDTIERNLPRQTFDENTEGSSHQYALPSPS